MKKSLIALLALLLPSYVLFALPTVVSAQTDEIPAVSSNHCGAFVDEYVFEDADGSHSVIIDHQTHILTIDGVEIIPEIEEIPLTRATVDYSTGVNLSYNIPWKTAAKTLVALIALQIPSPTAQAIINVAVGSAIDEGNDLIVTMTQYMSSEQYYSTYYGTYYKKAINKNIRAYFPANRLIYGPVDGQWFDPVRPY